MDLWETVNIFVWEKLTFTDCKFLFPINVFFGLWVLKFVVCYLSVCWKSVIRFVSFTVLWVAGKQLISLWDLKNSLREQRFPHNS